MAAAQGWPQRRSNSQRPFTLQSAGMGRVAIAVSVACLDLVFGLVSPHDVRLTCFAVGP